MNWIEIMGPSGIGKSSFLKSMISSPVFAERRWYTNREALIEVAKQVPAKNFINSFIKIYINQSFMKSKKLDFSELVLEKKNAYLEGASEYNFWISDYLDYYLSSMQESPEERLYRVGLLKSKIEELCILDYYNFSSSVIFDEGLINHHPGLNVNTKNIISKKPAGLIFCNLDIETTFLRVKEREMKRGIASTLHRGMTDKQLLKDITTRYNAYEKKKEIVMSYKIPFINVDLNETTHKDLIKVSQFLNNIDKPPFNDTSH